MDSSFIFFFLTGFTGLFGYFFNTFGRKVLKYNPPSVDVAH